VLTDFPAIPALLLWLLVQGGDGLSYLIGFDVDKGRMQVRP
jgi:hypothetical protein